MSYQLQDKPADGKLFAPTSDVPTYEGDSYTTSKPVDEGHRNIWQRSIDSFKPPVGQHAPHNSGDVTTGDKPVSRSLLLRGS